MAKYLGVPKWWCHKLVQYCGYKCCEIVALLSNISHSVADVRENKLKYFSISKWFQVSLIYKELDRSLVSPSILKASWYYFWYGTKIWQRIKGYQNDDHYKLVQHFYYKSCEIVSSIVKYFFLSHWCLEKKYYSVFQWQVISV